MLNKGSRQYITCEHNRACLQQWVGHTLIQVKGSRVCAQCVGHAHENKCVLVREHAYYNRFKKMSLSIFFQIVKGRTYTHMRNQHLNMILSGVLIIVIAGALGLGIGNFLGMISP
jgi:hypothetical protein